MPWLQLKVNTPRPQTESLENALLVTGAVSVTLSEHIPDGETEKPILEPGLGETPLWDTVTITGLYDANADTDAIKTQLRKLFPEASWQWEQLEDKDWEREWMKNYHPIQCSDNLWICPSWLTPPNPNAVNILLDPGLAFGTGTHPTTFLCLQWLAEQDLSGKTVIDYGCGSGILGIAALLLGAEKVIGVDIDPQALLATQENVKRNHLDPESFPVYLPGKIDEQLTVDVMLANILAGPLVELAPMLLQHTHKESLICLSGILNTQQTAIEAAYNKAATLDPVATKEEWIRVTGHVN